MPREVATSKVELQRAVREALAAPQLARNSRGRTKAALEILPDDMQRELACSFVEHAFELLFRHKSQEYRSVFAEGVQAIRDAMRGQVELKEVHEKEERAIGFSAYKELLADDTEMSSIGEEGKLLRMLKKCCLQREMEANGLLWRSRHQPSVSKIADFICHVISHAVGGADWDSDDPDLKKRARERGRDASDKESHWQQGAIMDSLRA